MSRTAGSRGAGTTASGVRESASALSEAGPLPGGKGVVEDLYELLWTKNNLLQVQIGVGSFA